jgi:DNA-binding transcriptional MerR regulator
MHRHSSVSGKTYSMEEVTERLGLTPRTLHYYEEIGLLENVPRTEGGHRYYPQATLERLERIVRLKELLGASLQDIRSILNAEQELDRLRSSYHGDATDEEKERLLDEAMQLLQQQIDRMEHKLKHLQAMKQGFEQRLEKARSLKKKGAD